MGTDGMSTWSDGTPSHLVEALHEHALAHPDRTAVSARDGMLTYRELDERSTRSAAALAARGVRPESIVALLTGRTTALAVGIFAILKAGAAYLPVEPGHPGERTLDLVRTAGCEVVVTTAELADQGRARADLAGLAQVRIAAPGCEPPPAEEPPGPLPQRERASLSYVLATSGSTGAPKGVQIEDHNVLALVAALDEVILHPLGGPLRIALVAPYIFDASVQQIFPALLGGHTLVIVPERVRTDGTLLRKFWAAERIDVSDGTPAHLRMTAQAPSAPRISVRRLLIGGDTLAPEVTRRFLAQCDHPDVRIMNMYGVAECCVDSIAGWVDPTEEGNVTPIGAPLPGSVVTLVDSEQRPVRDGELGEIHVGGSGVGRGYLARDDLNAARFYLPDGAGGRCYRTGDFARRLPDGRLVFAGRADRQFKVRGHRIEPAEIEAAVRRYADATRPEPGAAGAAVACGSCLMTSAYPGITVRNGRCNVCRDYSGYRDDVAAYFGDHAEFVRQVRQHNSGRDTDYDALLLFSGGKDSSYALYRMRQAGLRILAFTFDNGYISKAAFKNIRRITDATGIDLEVGTVDNMDAIFAESLRTDSTVCTGCFRGLTAMSTKLARERGIHVVVTGLSRGQIFDTKLRRLVEAGIREPAEIDRRLVTHRKLYHARRDRTSDLLALPVESEALDSILFMDYFRYDASTTTDIIRFLVSNDAAWAHPEDTGMCSTNCQVNEVGIYVHSLERGFHNYAAPLSWDCRLGVLERAQGLRELAAVAPRRQVAGILRRLGYIPRPRHSVISDAVVVFGPPAAAEPRLCGYYTANREIDDQDLREYLAGVLPDYMVPQHLVRLDRLPITDTGKLDLAALPDPRTMTAADAADPPRGAVEERIAAIWIEALGVDRIGRNGDFFEAGGDSLTATIVAGLLQAEFGVAFPVADLFVDPTIAHAAAMLAPGPAWAPSVADATHPVATVPITPIRLNAGPGSGNLVLLPDVWGGVDGYQALATHLERRVWGLAGPPVAAPSGPRHDPIDEMCRAFAERILTLVSPAPVSLAGWSFGGTLAFGTAHHVRTLGGRVARVLILDAVPPDRGYWSDQVVSCQDFLDGGTETVPYEVRRVMPPDLALDHDAARGYARRVMPALLALACYEPPAEAAGEHLTYLRAAGSGLTDDHTRRWGRFAPDRFTAAVVPGDHFSVLAAGHAGALARYF